MSEFLLFVDTFIACNPYFQAALSFTSGFVLMCASFYGIYVVRERMMLKKSEESFRNALAAEHQRMMLELLSGKKTTS